MWGDIIFLQPLRKITSFLRKLAFIEIVKRVIIILLEVHVKIPDFYLGDEYV